MGIRCYNPDRDLAAVTRIWQECGWLQPGQDEQMSLVTGSGRSVIAEIDGEAECLVITGFGHLKYITRDVRTSFVKAVTTSHVARKQGLAGRVTAQCVAHDAVNGAALSTLGMFEQGFYDRLGYGTGAYIRRLMVDPSTLRVEPARRAPRRLSRDDYELIHASRLRRMRQHGGCNIDNPAVTHVATIRTTNGFGLGYCDGPKGELTHHMWFMVTDSREIGPYWLAWMTYETNEQFKELLGLLRNLGDQIYAVRIEEPAHVQLQDLIPRPMAQMSLTHGSQFSLRKWLLAYQQFRICDLSQCVAAFQMAGDSVRFNLVLSDPIERYLDDDAPWRGVAGEYVIEFGPASGVEHGHDKSLPTMRASVNAFTRMWLGVRPASGLAVTDDLDAPQELLEQLDAVLRLPQPQTDWNF